MPKGSQAGRQRPTGSRLLTPRFGLPLAEVASTIVAVGTSVGLYIAYGHRYLPRGVLGDVLGLAVLTAVMVWRRQRARHEAAVCLVVIFVVLAEAPQWPLQISDGWWWAVWAAALVGYLAARRRTCPRTTKSL